MWLLSAFVTFPHSVKLNLECRRLAYIALVRSRLEYAETVWDPYYQQDIEKLERVQRQAARFITKDYRTREPGCVNRMLQDLYLLPLAERHRQARLGLTYKITGGLIPAIPPPKLPDPSECLPQTDTTHQVWGLWGHKHYRSSRSQKYLRFPTACLQHKAIPKLLLRTDSGRLEPSGGEHHQSRLCQCIYISAEQVNTTCFLTKQYR